MSIGPTHSSAVAAGSPLAQTKGVELDRAQETVGAQARQVYHDRKAEAADGVGEPDGENHQTAERDGDGRRAWEDMPEPEAQNESGDRKSKDPSQQSGNLLDLTG